MDGAGEVLSMARFCLMAGSCIGILALLADGKFLFQGIIGIFTARLPETASVDDRRRVRANRVKWLLGLPYFMLFSLKRMRREHMVIAQEKGLKLGAGYRFMVIWHIFWLAVLGIGYLSVYLGAGAVMYAAILLFSRN